MSNSGVAVASNSNGGAAGSPARTLVSVTAAAAGSVGSSSGTNSVISQIISLTSAAPRGSRGSSAESLYEEPTNSSAGTQSGDELCPMDLSSGGATGVLGGSSLHPFSHPALLHSPFATLAHLQGLEEQSLINAKRLAELVKAQHLAQTQQREQNETTPPNTDSAQRLPKKRHWVDVEEVGKKMAAPSEYADSPQTEPDETPMDLKSNKSLIPLELIRAKWENNTHERASPESASSGTPSVNTKPGGGREVKKRRLDALLNKKFGDSPSSSIGSRSPPNPTPSPQLCVKSESPEVPVPKKINRRKQSNPMTPAPTPPTLSIRPPSDLFPARSIPTTQTEDYEDMKEHQRSRLEAKAPESPKLRQQDLLKSQILQLQLAQAALLSGVGSSGSNPDFIKSALMTSSNLMSSPTTAAAAASTNPLLYYGYYAQMFQGLQAQQSKLVEQLMASPKPNGPGSSSLFSVIPKIEPTTQPRELPPSPKDFRSEYDRFSSYSNLRGPLSPLGNFRNQSSPHHHPMFPPGPNGSSNGNGGSSPLSPNDEPRRRAPRALTGRHVRSGTGASPRTLEILRKKILERMKLKELLGENSHLYFGALNKKKTHGGKKHQLTAHHQQLTAAAAAMVALNGKHH